MKETTMRFWIAALLILLFAVLDAQAVGEEPVEPAETEGQRWYWQGYDARQFYIGNDNRLDAALAAAYITDVEPSEMLTLFPQIRYAGV